MLIGLTLIAVQGLFAQAIPILEMPFVTTVTNMGTGSSISPVIAEYKLDATNNNTFSTYSPTSTFTVALTNQRFTGLNYGTANYQGSGYSTQQSTGLVFGLEPTVATDPLPQGGFPANRYNKLGTYAGGSGGPTSAMFTASPSATGADLGTGIAPILGPNNKINGGVEIFTTAQVLYYDTITYPRGSRVYYGDLVLKFSQPVRNPVIHVAGLGGSYRFVIPGGNPLLASDYRSTFFTTELELANTGLTSTLLSGNAYMALAGNNIVNTNHADPNGGSLNDPTETPFNNLGAATGSIRINGVVQEIVYRVYLQGGSASQFAWAYSGALLGAPRDPFTGDIWYVAASYDKPTPQQISGSVLIDRDGIVPVNNINQSDGVENPKTNASNSLYAFLLLNNTVIASVPVQNDGNYLFENVAVTGPAQSYTVQIRNGAAGTAPGLPAGWINTGENIGTGAGSDGLVNGTSASFLVNNNEFVRDVNFGIERLPDSKNFTTVITTPPMNATITLSTPGNAPYGNLPILSGSDAEDMPTEGVLTGKSVKFTTLATVGSINTPAVLRYNGNVITLNQVITNFNPALLTVSLPNPWAGSGLQFNYAYVDAAGFADPTPALYKLLWSGGGPLIINLSEFIATKNSCTANLTWKTSSEENGDRFEIEVSTNTNAVYSKVGTVAAIGNSTTTKAYQFSYPMQPGVTYYFRLKMVDRDGSFKYSDTRSLNCSKGNGGIVIAPNPVRDVFNIRGMENGKNTVVVYAANGQLVKTQVIAQNQGDVNIYNLAPGVYSVKVTSEAGNSVTSKIIKY